MMFDDVLSDCHTQSLMMLRQMNRQKPDGHLLTSGFPPSKVPISASNCYQIENEALASLGRGESRGVLVQC